MWLKCGKCGYMWHYKGKKVGALARATCPNCLGKVKVGQAEVNRTVAVSRTAKVTRDTLEGFGFSVSTEDLQELLKKALERAEKEEKKKGAG